MPPHDGPTTREQQMLRQLAERVAEIAALPIQADIRLIPQHLDDTYAELKAAVDALLAERDR